MKQDLRLESMDPESWDVVYSALATAIGDTWGEFVSYLDRQAEYLSHLGQPVRDFEELWRASLQQAIGFQPVSTMGASLDAAASTPGISMGFSRAFSPHLGDRSKPGPMGRGWSHSWEVSLTFEPDGTAVVEQPGGAQRFFQPSRTSFNSYISQPGDLGRLVRKSNPTRYELAEPDGTRLQFRSDGTLEFVEDPNGNRVTTTFTSGRLTALGHSSGQAVTMTYVGDHIRTVTDDVGRVTTYDYDGEGHLRVVLHHDDRITRYTYATGSDAVEHALASIEYPDGTSQFFEYDTAGRMSATQATAGANRVEYSYGPFGLVTSRDADGGETRAYFNQHGQVAKVVDALARTTFFTFDELGRVTHLTDPADRVAFMEYDERGNVTRQVDAAGRITRFEFQPNTDRLVRVIDPLGQSIRYAYDPRGNLTTITYADGSVDRSDYDGLGQVIRTTNRRGQSIEYAFDLSGRPLTKTSPGGSTVEYTYDDHGNMATATDASGTTTLEYDESDRILRVTEPSGRFLEYSYNPAGRRDRMVDQDGFATRYDYDLLGRLTRLTEDNGTLLVRYDYDAIGRLEREEKGNGTYSTYTFDAAGQLESVTNHAPDGVPTSWFDYTFDTNGRLSSLDTHDGLWTYSYDAVGRLTQAVFDATNAEIPDQDLLYEYDAAGNRQRTVENGVESLYVVNSLNQYTSVGNTTYEYDASGNVVLITSPTGSTSLAYDAENRLVSVSSPTDESWQYAYDVFGRRATSTDNGVTRRSIYDHASGQLVATLDAQGSLQERFVHALRLVGRIDGLGTYHDFAYDAYGSTVSITNATGNLEQSAHYLPFGGLLHSSGASEASGGFLAAYGARSDGSGLVHLPARSYVPETGRFLSPDPIGILDGLDLYSYARQSPMNLIDTTGGKSRPPGRFYIPPNGNPFHRFYIPPGKNPFSRTPPVLDNYPSVQKLRHQWLKIVPGSTKLLGNFGDPRISSLLIGWELGILFEYEGGAEVLGGWVYEGSKYFPGSTEVLSDWGYQLQPFSDNLDQSLENFGKWIYDATHPGHHSITRRPSPRSGDPNQKLGPAGYGESNYVAIDATLPYRIDFENEPNATAPAQRIVVTDVLDPAFDLHSFVITEIAIGSLSIPILPGAQYVYETVSLTATTGNPIDVVVEAGVDYDTRTLYLLIQAIDPLTGFPPELLTGVLPPEDGTGRGQGHISYLIGVEPEVASGTVIRNIATIVFDLNDPITTNQIDPLDPSAGTDPALEAFITIDAGIPSSHVLPLPAARPAAFEVTWSGQDEPSGSGVATYDLFVSTDGGEYLPWLIETTLVSALFEGEPGHAYSFYSIAKDHVGHAEPAPAAPDATTFTSLPLVVISATPAPSGVMVRFDRPINPAALSLIDLASGAFGPADVTLVGAVTGPIRGTLVLGPDSRSVTFLATGGPLPPDTYTLTLRSAANGFSAGSGLLDGNADGTAGDPYVTIFTVDTPPAGAVTVSIPDFVRGQTQAVHIPSNSTNGLPIRLSDGAGITQTTIELAYNQALLSITGVVPGPSVPIDWTFELDLSTDGVARLVASGSIPLPAGPLDLARLVAAVPADAPYTSKQRLDLRNVVLLAGASPIPAIEDDAVHIATYLGDLNADGLISSADVTLSRRLIGGLDSGFATAQLADPRVVGDLTNDLAMSSADVTQARRYIGALSSTIPALGPAGPAIVGPDPLLSIPRNLVASAGGYVTIPIWVENTSHGPIGIAGFDLVIAFDPERFELLTSGELRPGLGHAFAAGTEPFDLAFFPSAPGGVIHLTGNSRTGAELALAPGERQTLAHITLRVREHAPKGPAAINLRANHPATGVPTSLSDATGTSLLLAPAPTNAPADPVDGVVTIRSLKSRTHGNGEPVRDAHRFVTRRAFFTSTIDHPLEPMPPLQQVSPLESRAAKARRPPPALSGR
jgi:RHS repeat-associated protein